MFIQGRDKIKLREEVNEDELEEGRERKRADQ
jgi:hypothetical protein